MYFLYKNAYRTFTTVEITIRRGLRWKGDEPIQVIIHIYMEMSQGNSLYKNSLFKKKSFSFLSQNWRIGRQNRSCLGELVPAGGGGAGGKV
jgi:hypothetical protein